MAEKLSIDFTAMPALPMETEMRAFPSSRLINLAAAMAAGTILLFGSAAAHASSVVARISISTQTMEVIVDGRRVTDPARWPDARRIVIGG